MFSTSLITHYQTCECDILTTDKPILLRIGTSGPWKKDMKQSTSVVRRSEMKPHRRLKLDLEAWRKHHC